MGSAGPNSTDDHGESSQIAADYGRLSPDLVLDAIDSTGLRADGRLMALNSFENRVYQVGIEDDGFRVAKFYRPNRWSDEAIDEEHRFTLALAEADIPVTPPLALNGRTTNTYEGYRFAVFPRQGGREPELESAENLAWLGRSIGRMHSVGRRVHLDHRRRLLDADRVAEASRLVLTLEFVPPHLVQSHEATCQAILEHIRMRFDFAEAGWMQAIHGDLHRGNVLWTEEGPHFVDFDDCVTGPAVADFWMLLDGDPEARAGQLEILLEGYEQFMDFDRFQLVLIEALRAARMIEYAAWIAQRWDDPAFPASFPWFGQPRFWEEHVSNLNEQLARLATPTG
ncbi:MAG: serine/threonine protein kinase [Pseudomonadota bacterium]